MKITSLWKQWASKLRLEVYTIYYAYRDPKTPWYAKLLGALVLAYAFSPIDLIPDFIPILGYVDDLILIPLGIALVLRLIPKNIIIECKQLALQRMDSRKPKNWFAGSIVIAVWVGLVALILYIVLHNPGR
jgi:uncharacterized membrane protein YkvA (DUF1232 family)